MFTIQEIKRSFLISLWFVFLTFPIMVVRVNSIEKTVHWRWENIIYVAIGSFFLSMIFRYYLHRREMQSGDDTEKEDNAGQSFLHGLLENPVAQKPPSVSISGRPMIEKR